MTTEPAHEDVVFLESELAAAERLGIRPAVERILAALIREGIPPSWLGDQGERGAIALAVVLDRAADALDRALCKAAFGPPPTTTHQPERNTR